MWLMAQSNTVMLDFSMKEKYSSPNDNAGRCQEYLQ